MDIGGEKEMYTSDDANREIGSSIDWILGLEVSIKKWEQIVKGNYDDYLVDENCGLCYIAINRAEETVTHKVCEICMNAFPAMIHLCDRGNFVEEIEPKRMLTYMRGSLTRLQGNEND